MKTKAECADWMLGLLYRHGEWDDGCFYYNKTSASELEMFIRVMESINKKETPCEECNCLGGSHFTGCSGAKE